MKRLKLIDEIIKEPVGGAHADREGAYTAVKNQILKAFDEIKDIEIPELIMQRMDKYSNMGVYKE
jgi:acetyl-CoA carboxylase carboxyl transferase subunit alpha